MNILLINTFDKKGGAAIASNRLYNSLKNKGHKVNLLVGSSTTNEVSGVCNNYISKKNEFLKFSLERFKILRNIDKKENLYAFDSSSYGFDISNHRLVKQADIIHLHWINFGFISLKGLKKLAELNKPILWTLHDMWLLTGGCFYSDGCEKYKIECKNCKYLKKSSKLAEKIFNFKKELFKLPNFYPVAISSWTKTIIEDSYLFKNKKVIELSNPIDMDTFFPISKVEAKQKLNLSTEKKHIGFVAFNVNDTRKGAIYLKNSLLELFNERKDLKDKVELIAIGRIKDKEFFDNLPVKFAGYISDKSVLNLYYNACDFMLLPSLEDNLPLVIQEAMTCKTPLVAFNTGGIKDLVIHKKTGYLAKQRNNDDFKNGILYLIENNTDELKQNARNHVVNNYSNSVISEKAIKTYENILTKNK